MSFAEPSTSGKNQTELGSYILNCGFVLKTLVENDCFTHGVRALGKDKVAHIRHLRIEWSDEQVSYTKWGPWDNIAPFGIRLMGILCQYWMPSVTKVEFHRVAPSHDSELITAGTDDEILLAQETRTEFIKKNGVLIYSPDWGYSPYNHDGVLIVVLKHFIKACDGLKELELDIFHGFTLLCFLFLAG
jgi:hypothetical protein